MTTKTTAQKSALTDATGFEPVTEESFSDSPKRARVRKATVKAVTAGKARRTGTQADKVRAMFLKDPAARPSIVAKATGVDPAYVWDLRQAMRRKGTIATVQPTATPAPAATAPTKPASRSYAKRVRALEDEGMTTSDARAVADAEARAPVHVGGR